MEITSKWFRIAFLNLLVATCFGALLRLAFVTEISWLEFRYLLHGHSHVAMLGWLFSALYILLLHNFVEDYRKKRIYTILFWLIQTAIWGMAISFPLEGYKPFSIFFSTFHVILSYIFALYFFRDLKKQNEVGKTSSLFARTALLLMVLSTLALFAMAPIMLFDLRQSTLYYMSVQFFLHFQFNGWFVFGILAIAFRFFEKWGIFIEDRQKKIFYWLLLASCFLTYALAVTWSNPSSGLFFANGLGVLVQLAALIYFVKFVVQNWKDIREHISPGVKSLLAFSFLSFCLKIIVQSAVVIPYIATIAYTIRNYVIGFIHLILLGAITFAALSFANESRIINLNNKLLKSGIVFLALGFILSELILFLQGTMFWASFGFMPYYYELLFGVSCLMPFGVLLMVLSRPDTIKL